MKPAAWARLFLLFLILLTGCSSFPSSPSDAVDENTLRAGIDDLVNGPEATRGFLGVSLRACASGRQLYQKDAEKLFTPASTVKLFTTAAALVTLGPDFRYATRLYAAGPVEGGVLRGDLFVRGSGDPTISETFHGRPTTVFEAWAERLRQQGIRVIDGDLVGDRSLFDERDLGAGWAWDDELACYSARLSAVSFNDNCFEVSVSPASKPGEQAVVTVCPQTSYGLVENRVVTSEAGGTTHIEAARPFGCARITLSGRICPSGKPWRLKCAAADPTLYAMTVLKEVLEAGGIEVRGRPTQRRTAPDYSSLRLLFTHESEPLSRIIEVTNKESRNLYAELLFRTLGTLRGGRGTAEAALEVIGEALAPMGITSGSLALCDGSGLSRLNLVAPAQVTQLLASMSHHPFFPYFYRSLPVAGVDGTLVRRMRNTGAEGRIRAKTGTLAHTVALSGYMPDGKGGLVAFSLMGNNCPGPAREARSLWDDLCARLARLLAGK